MGRARLVIAGRTHSHSRDITTGRTRLGSASVAVWMRSTPLVRLPIVERAVGLGFVMQGLGLDQLRERLSASAGEVAEAASKLWDEVESMDAKAVVDNVRLKADEYLADSEVKEAFSASIARLNKLVCQAEGFNGVWVGKSDGQQRCTIQDAIIHWHWGEESELEIWSATEVSTTLGQDTFHGNLREDGSLFWQEDGDYWVCSERAGPSPPPGAPDGEAPAADVALVQRSLQDLRRIVASEGAESSME
ncbi:unnamed protein product, partial [Prorocentrum cordatum]